MFDISTFQRLSASLFIGARARVRDAREANTQWVKNKPSHSRLSGWFSKTTTDKLQEVFETLLKTDQDKKRKDKLRVD